MHEEQPTHRRAGGTAPLPPDEMRCPCGSTVLRPHAGFWRGLWWYFLLPVITLAIYALMVLVGAELAQGAPAIGMAFLLVPVISVVIVLITMLIFRHRGWCLLRRTVAWWFWWPGTVLLIVASF